MPFDPSLALWLFHKKHGGAISQRVGTKNGGGRPLVSQRGGGQPRPLCVVGRPLAPLRPSGAQTAGYLSPPRGGPPQPQPPSGKKTPGHPAPPRRGQARPRCAVGRPTAMPPPSGAQDVGHLSPPVNGNLSEPPPLLTANTLDINPLGWQCEKTLAQIRPSHPKPLGSCGDVEENPGPTKGPGGANPWPFLYHPGRAISAPPTLCRLARMGPPGPTRKQGEIISSPPEQRERLCCAAQWARPLTQVRAAGQIEARPQDECGPHKNRQLGMGHDAFPKSSEASSGTRTGTKG